MRIYILVLIIIIWAILFNQIIYPLADGSTTLLTAHSSEMDESVKIENEGKDQKMINIT